jgi:hypothetical protein
VEGGAGWAGTGAGSVIANNNPATSTRFIDGLITSGYLLARRFPISYKDDPVYVGV